MFKQRYRGHPPSTKPELTGTAIVIIRTPEALWVGADSYIPVLGGQAQIGCKIFRIADLHFALAGILYYTGTAFDSRHFASQAVRQSGSIAERADAFVKLSTKPIQETVQDIERVFPDFYATGIRNQYFYEIVFFGMENNQPTFAHRWFHAQSKAGGKIVITTGGESCPGSACPRGRALMPIGKKEGIQKAMNARGFSFLGDPVSDITKLIEIEKEHTPKWVGGPVDIIRIDSSGAHWETPNSECTRHRR